MTDHPKTYADAAAFARPPAPGPLLRDFDHGAVGLTKREYFAALMLQGILINEGCRDWLVEECIPGASSFAPNDANRAIIYADCLIAALNRKSQ